MRHWWLIGLALLLCTAAPAEAQISVGIGVPSLDIGIHLPGLPSLSIVPGSPVYYAPRVNSNFFFYDGMYWVYQDDNWYSSSWYNGPWAAVDPNIVPEFVLRVPVRYYRHPPTYFRDGRRTRRRDGASIGATTGSRRIVAGITWSGVRYRAPRPYPPTSGTTRRSITRRFSNSRPYTSRTTSTSLVRLSYSSTISNTLRLSSTVSPNVGDKRRVKSTRIELGFPG